MANVVKMQEEFNRLMKKYESASMIREWNNAARSVQLDENMKARKQEIDGFKKRFQAAVDEEETVEEPTV